MCLYFWILGIWSQNLLRELQTSEASLEATVKVVNGRINAVQQTQIIGNGMADICWKSEANQVPEVPPCPADIVQLCKDLELYRKGKKQLGHNCSCNCNCLRDIACAVHAVLCVYGP